MALGFMECVTRNLFLVVAGRREREREKVELDIVVGPLRDDGDGKQRI